MRRDFARGLFLWRDFWVEGFCPKALNMSFDRFLLALESCDLSQADKSVFFSKLSDDQQNSKLHQKNIWHLVILQN